MADTVPPVADQTAAPSTSSYFNLAAHKETAVLALSFIAPPAAIALRQGKVDLESRQLAVSLALYLSVFLYLPAVAHAYWLLYIRDNGGLEEWSGARRRQVEGLWNEHGATVKDKANQYAPKLVERAESVHTYATEKVKYATEKKNEAVSFVSAKRAAATEFYGDAKEAYATGTVIDWVKEKLRPVVDYVNSRLDSYPRVQAVVLYLEQRLPLVAEFFYKIYETIRSKLTSLFSSADDEEQDQDESTLTCEEQQQQPAAAAAAAAVIPSTPKQEIVMDDHEGTISSVESPKSEEDVYETAEDITMDKSFLEGGEEEEEDEDDREEEEDAELSQEL